MIKVLELPLEEDIGPLCQYLNRRGVPMRVIESDGQQQLWVAHEQWREPLLDAYERYRSDPEMREHLQAHVRDMPRRSGTRFRDQLMRSPMIVGLLVTLTLVALITGFGTQRELYYPLLIIDLEWPETLRSTPSEALGLVLERGQWWRIFSPAWLHWGVAHWAFNVIALLIFGRSLEAFLGNWRFLLLVFLTAGCSNLVQYYFSGPFFGGFSGVVFGLVGAQLAGQVLRPDYPQWPPRALIAFALFSLALGLTGILELGGLHLAHGAHFGGLVTGFLVMASLLGWKKRV